MSDPKPGRQQLSGYVMRDYEHLIATLCASRDSQRLTNADVGRRIPIDRASVSRWLTGRSTPYGTRLVELIGALGYELALVPRGANEAAECGCPIVHAHGTFTRHALACSQGPERYTVPAELLKASETNWPGTTYTQTPPIVVAGYEPERGGDATAPERIEYDATTYRDLGRGVRVFMRPDGSRREEPWEGA